MSRPIKTRTTKSFARDVESLGRLRLALVADPRIPSEKIRAVTHDIDRVIERLLDFTRSYESEPSSP